MARTSSLVRPGLALRINAQIPATRGVAEEVPLKVAK